MTLDRCQKERGRDASIVLEMDDEPIDSLETLSQLDRSRRSIRRRMTTDSDSDWDDFNDVLRQTDDQLLKAQQSLDKKKEQPQPVLSSIERYDEKYVNDR